MTRDTIARARDLRKALTPQEARLWLRLRDFRRHHGVHFRRQAPRDGYILDFVCLSNRLIVEVDGAQHGFDEIATRDRQRDRHFQGQGFRTLRFTNAEINTNIDGVVETIFNAIQGN